MLIIRAQTQHSRRGRQFRDCPAINGACEVAFFTISKFSIASLFTLTAEYKGIVGRLPPPIENINGDAVVIYHGANRGKLATFLCHSSHKPAQIHSIAPRFIHADAQCTRQFGENVRDLRLAAFAKLASLAEPNSTAILFTLFLQAFTPTDQDVSTLSSSSCATRPLT